MTGVPLEAVKHVPLFADWNRHEIQEIASLFKEHRFSKGEIVVKEGSVGDSFFLIDSGEAVHWRQGAHEPKARRPIFR